MSLPQVDKIKKDDFYLPTLQVLRDLGGSASIEEIEERLIDRFAFTQADLDATYPTSGDNIITDKMSWARSYLKFPGFVTNDKGVWVLTEAGRLAVDQPVDKVRGQIREAKALRRAEQLKAKSLLAPIAGLSGSTSDPEAQEQAEEEAADWSDTLLAKLQSIAPDAFERLCRRLLLAHGFTRVDVTGKSGDGGIDGSGVLRVNLVSFHVLFQCKRYKGSVSTGTIRDFRGAMQGRADKGLVITTGTFTPDARREARRDGAPAIDLIDGEALCDLLREVNLGVVVRPVTTYEISIDHAFFDEV
jgi:restriction system protein